jgi:hypothetical protein
MLIDEPNIGTDENYDPLIDLVLSGFDDVRLWLEFKGPQPDPRRLTAMLALHRQPFGGVAWAEASRYLALVCILWRWGEAADVAISNDRAGDERFIADFWDYVDSDPVARELDQRSLANLERARAQRAMTNYREVG